MGSPDGSADRIILSEGNGRVQPLRDRYSCEGAHREAPSSAGEQRESASGVRSPSRLPSPLRFSAATNVHCVFHLLSLSPNQPFPQPPPPHLFNQQPPPLAVSPDYGFACVRLNAFAKPPVLTFSLNPERRATTILR